MTDSKKKVLRTIRQMGLAVALLAAGLASVAYLLMPKGGPATPRPRSNLKVKADESAEGLPLKRAPLSSNKDFIKAPPQSKVLARSSTTKGRISESTLKLESWLSPTELQVYFTDLLVDDWMIARDDLTEGVGWSGVFMQIEPNEMTMGVFAVVEKIGPQSGQANPTAISIIKVEER